MHLLSALVSWGLSQVGALIQYLVDQSFMCAKVRVGSEYADIQPTIQAFTFNAVTGLDELKLLDDYTHIFLELHNKQAMEGFPKIQQCSIHP